MSYPIIHLEISDFDSNGNLKNSFFDDKLTILMIQYTKCGFCHTLSPIYKSVSEYFFKQNDKIVLTTVVLDSEFKSEREIVKIIDKIVPDIKGVPSFVVFKNKKVYSTEDPENYSFEGLKKYILTYYNVE